MPFYEYKCDFCFTEETKLRKVSERFNTLPCPNCRNNMNLLFSGFSTSNGFTNEAITDHGVKVNKTQDVKSRGLQIHGNHFVNCDVGISLPRGIKADMQGNTFENVKTPMQLRDK